MLRNNVKSKYIIMLFLVILSTFGVIIFCPSKNGDGKLIINGINIQNICDKNNIGVYIDGEIKNPGFIQIPTGENLEYALNKIGGITDNADIQNIDLNKVLKDGEKIIIPSKIKDYKEDNTYSDTLSNSIVNINSASKNKLKTLEGIGDKTAENIIEYRKKNKFYNIEEIMKVKGIGEGKYEKIKNNICV